MKCVPLHSLSNTDMGIQGVQRLAETLKVNRVLEVIRYSVVHWVLGSIYIYSSTYTSTCIIRIKLCKVLATLASVHMYY